MLKFKQLIAFVVIGLIAGQAMAEGRIAIVNLQRAIVETTAAKERLQAVREEADVVANMKAAEQLQAEGQAMIEKLQKDGPVMSVDQQENLKKRIQEKQADLEHIGRKLQAREQEVMQEIMQQAQQQARLIVQELIKAEGIGLLLDARSALHVDTSYDITAKVTQGLNAAQ